MKPVHVLILAVLVIGAGAAIWLGSGDDTDARPTDQKLFPDLAGKIDTVGSLTVSDAKGGKVTIERQDDGWIVKEKSKYAANTSKVGELLLNLADATLVEQKTSNPEFYARIGVNDVSNSDSSAVLLSVLTPGGKLNLLAGNSNDRFGGSTFVRKPESAPSYLVTPKLEASTDVNDWIDTRILDIAADDIQSVKVTGSDGEIAEISKAAMFDSEFDLVGREESQTLNAIAVRNLAGALAGLDFEDVKRGAAFAVNDYKRIKVTYTRFSGVVVDVTLFYRDDPADSDAEAAPQHYWLNAGARFDEALAQKFVPQPTANETSGGEALSLTSADIADRRAEAERINKSKRRWMYKITSAQFNKMNQSKSTLVNPN